MPTINLPIKSHEKITTTEPRRVLTYDRELPPPKEIKLYYKNLKDLQQKTSNLKFNGWRIDVNEKKIAYKFFMSPYLLPKYEIVIDENFGFNIIVFGWLLPDDHIIYKKYFRSMKNITVSELMKSLSPFKFCCGIDKSEEVSSSFMHHIIPVEFNLENEGNLSNKQFLRSKSCFVLHHSDKELDSICFKCIGSNKIDNDYKAKQKRKLSLPAKKNAPLSKTNPERIKLALQQERIRCNELTKQIEKMETEIKKRGVCVNEDISNDLKDIMEENFEKATPFMKFFFGMSK